MSVSLVKTAKNIRIGVLSLATSSVLFLAACSGDGRPLEEAIEAERLGIARNGLSIVQPTGLLPELFVNPGDQLKFEIEAISTIGEDIALSANDRRWSVDNTAVASIDSSGNFTAIADGLATINLQIGGQAAKFPVNVKEAVLDTINIAAVLAPTAVLDPTAEQPDTNTLERCIPADYTAKGSFRSVVDGTLSTRGLVNVQWSLENPELGSIGAQVNGIVPVTAVAAESLNLVATVGDTTGRETITVANNLVSIEISPGQTQITVPDGSDTAATAIGTYTRDEDPQTTDVSGSVLWAVPEGNGFATVQPNSGLITGVDVGDTTITAACGDEVSPPVAVVITPQSAAANTLSIDGGSEQSFSRTAAQVELQVSTGQVYDEENDVTDDDDTTWSVISGNEFADFQLLADSGVLTLLGEGIVTVLVEYRNVQRILTITVVQ